MPAIFDYTCSECEKEFEAFTHNVERFPDKCKVCGSTTATFTRMVSAPIWIEGSTHGSKPAPIKEAYNSPREMMQGHNDKKSHKRTIF